MLRSEGRRPVEGTRPPRVSVILPTRNRAGSLARAVASVRDQTEQEWELLIVDDASEDGTSAATVAWQAHDPRIRSVRLHHPLGGGGARNEGLHLARGVWVAFLDDDAEWQSNKLSFQLREARPGALVYGPVHGVAADGSTRRLGGPVDADAPLCGLAAGNLIDTSAVLVEREQLMAVGGFDEALPRLQDWDLWLRLVEQIRPAYHPDILARTSLTGPRISTRPGSLPVAAEMLARKHPRNAQLRATLGHMLLQEGDVVLGRRMLGEAASLGLKGPGVQLRRLLAAVAPGLYAGWARGSQAVRDRFWGSRK